MKKEKNRKRSKRQRYSKITLQTTGTERQTRKKARKLGGQPKEEKEEGK